MSNPWLGSALRASVWRLSFTWAQAMASASLDSNAFVWFSKPIFILTSRLGGGVGKGIMLRRGFSSRLKEITSSRYIVNFIDFQEVSC